MKRIISSILALTLMLCLVLSLASCAKVLSGKYTNSSLQTTYEFVGNTVTRTSPSLVGTILGSEEKVVKEGTYVINEAENGTFTITFTWGENDIETESFSEIEVDGQKSIKIGIVTFTKE